MLHSSETACNAILGSMFLFFFLLIIAGFVFFFYVAAACYCYFYVNHYRFEDAFNVKKSSVGYTLITFQWDCECIFRVRLVFSSVWCCVWKTKFVILKVKKWHVRWFNKYVFCWQSGMAEMIFIFYFFSWSKF